MTKRVADQSPPGVTAVTAMQVHAREDRFAARYSYADPYVGSACITSLWDYRNIALSRGHHGKLEGVPGRETF